MERDRALTWDTSTTARISQIIVVANGSRGLAIQTPD